MSHAADRPVPDAAAGGPDRGVSRRRVLAGAGLAAGAALGTGAIGDPSEAAAGPRPGGAGATVVGWLTDVHVEPDKPDNNARFAASLAAMAEAGVDAVVVSGDLSEYGSTEEFALFESLVPASLRPRLHALPGNHEARWDATAYATFTRYFGAPSSVVEVGSCSLVLLDTTTVQQELAWADAADLRWLDRALDRADAAPLVFSHFPIGESTYYVGNAEQLIDVLERHRVRAIFAGHTHAERVLRFNDLTQVVGRAGRNGAGWYRLTLAEGRLTVEFVPVADPVTGAAAGPAIVVAAVDLDAPSSRLEPREVTVTSGAETVGVTVRHRGEVDRAEAARYDAGVFAGSATEQWQPLTRRGPGTHRGAVDVAAWPAGVHRVVTRSTVGDRRWREVRTVVKPGAAYRPRWTLGFGAPLQGALGRPGPAAGVPDDLVVVGCPDGRLTAIEATVRGARRRWETRPGPVWTAPAFGSNGRLTVVGTAAGDLIAYDTATGRRRWRTGLGAPVMSDPLVAAVAGRETVVVAANRSLVAIDAATGTRRWRRDLPQPTMGRATTDGTLVFHGGGDGRAWALDGATGEPVWSTPTTDKPTTYGRLIYGPWDNWLTPVADDLVLVSTVSQVQALDRRSGTEVWRLAGSYIYCPPVIVGADVLLVDERGGARRVDQRTGAVRWTAQAAPRVLNAGPVVVDDDVIITGVSGLVTRHSLDDGTVQATVQATTTSVFATPALTDDDRLLIIGGYDGVLRAFDRP